MYDIVPGSDPQTFDSATNVFVHLMRQAFEEPKQASKHSNIFEVREAGSDAS